MGEIGTIAMSGAVTKGDNDRAIADCSKAIEDNPQDANANAYFDRGSAFNTRDRAIADFTKSNRGEPRLPRLTTTARRRLPWHSIERFQSGKTPSPRRALVPLWRACNSSKNSVGKAKSRHNRCTKLVQSCMLRHLYHTSFGVRASWIGDEREQTPLGNCHLYGCSTHDVRICLRGRSNPCTGLRPAPIMSPVPAYSWTGFLPWRERRRRMG